MAVTTANQFNQDDADDPCIFPALNDEVLGTTQWEDVEITRLQTDDIRDIYGVNVKTDLFLAAVWAVVMRQFADANVPRVWVCDLEAGTCQLLAVPIRDEMPFDRLLDRSLWSALSVHDDKSNTAVVISHDTLKEFSKGPGLTTKMPCSPPGICDVLLVAESVGNQLRLLLSYRSSLLSDFHASNIVDMIEHVARAVTRACNQQLEQLPSLTDRGLRQIRYWNSPAHDEAETFMHQVIAHRALSHPDIPAIEAWDGSLTYSQLEHKVSQLAAHLQEVGVGPTAMVPVCFEKSVWAVVAMCAVNKAGAAFVPLDPSQPIERLKTIIQNSGGHVVLASYNQAPVVAVAGRTVISVPKAPVQDLKSPSFCKRAVSSDPAYCLFTSGSTGEPKGCVVSQSAFASILYHAPNLHIKQGSRVLQFASLSFGIGLIEVFCTLSAGGTICMPSDDNRKNALAATINTMKIDWGLMTPTVLSTLDPTEVQCLKTVLVGGEPLRKAQVSVWSKAVRLFQAYGLTEWAGIAAVSRRMTPSQSPATLHNIGWPANGTFWLVDPDDHRKLRPIGTVAELVVEGPSLATGYLQDTHKTAEVFICPPSWAHDLSPHAKEQGRRLYKTGDLVRYSGDGSICYIGRKDTQVKIRGQRVELGEVEANVLLCFPEAKAAVAEVIPPNEFRSNSSLVVFILQQPEDKSNGNSIFAETDEGFLQKANAAAQRLKSRLPSYMVPAIFFPLRQIPRTVTGKTDRRQLRNQAASLPRGKWKSYMGATVESKQEPSTKIQQILARIWARLFNLPQEDIKADDDFIALGGDSIIAMRLVAMARAAGLEVTITDIFSHSTLSSLAQKATSVRETLAYEPFSLLQGPIRQFCVSDLRDRGIINSSSEIADIVPATGIQKFFFRQNGLDNFCFVLDGKVDCQRLKQACQAVSNNHSILRSIFTTNIHGFFQVILSKFSIQWHRVTTYGDLPGVCDSLCDPTINGTHHFDQVLTRFTLVSCWETRHVLIVRLSHAQSDALSIPIVLSDIAAAYDGAALSPTMQFSHFVHERERKDLLAGRAFWRRYLGQGSMSWLTSPVTQLKSGPMAGYEIVVKKKDILPHPILPVGITTATLGKAAWTYVLAQHTKKDDQIFGQTVNGRSLPLTAIDSAVGPFINFVPFRARVQHSWPVAAFLEYVQQQYLQTLKYDYMDSAQILNTNEDSAPDLFGSIFHHQNDENFKIPFKDIVQTSSFVRFSAFPQKLTVWVFCHSHETKLELRIMASAAAADINLISPLLEQLEHTVQAFINHPSTPLQELGSC